MEGCRICVLEDVLLLWRRGCLCSGRVQNLCLGEVTFAVKEGVYSFCFGGSAFENEVQLIKGTIYEVIIVFLWVEFFL